MTTRLDHLDTPITLIDRDVLVRNVDRMADAVRSTGLALRPHVKTHKLPQIAALQLAAGAVGLTVATIGEAEVFVEHGAPDVFIAYPLWVGPRAAARLMRLAALARVSVGTDSVEAAQNLATRLGPAVDDVDVLVEVDSGHHRSGVAPAEAVAVADAAQAGGLHVTGVFTFPGHSYGPGMPSTAVADEQRALGEAADALTGAGFDVERISGGSTPTALLTDASVATEVRPGVYVFGDAQQLELERCRPEDIALTVIGTVVSRHDGDDGTPRRVVLDTGSKVLGADRPPWTTGFGRVAGELEARITALSEHHATVVWPDDRDLPVLGSRLHVIPNHVCVAVNLVDEVTVVSDGAVVDRWRVTARGRNS
ncbi:alanine racemase [Tersicoccus phoenicis]|uniref:Alanine racemase n=1 Tax=Tersicoccus phoenicis TaxID=554083 RepID=A0A1R1LB79_9MICC|nr:alanine racemase [Tersicoccus phoenicis]OMH24795.1 alanine racemase [Tersicoccus phoenicis]